MQMNSTGRTIIFDENCKLCATAANYIIRHDPEGLFRFAAMQGETGRRLIQQYRGADFDFGTLILIRDRVCYERGDAILEIFRELPGTRFQYRALQLTPRPFRNFLYRIIARYRYRLFGSRGDMTMPPGRFLD